MADKQLFRLPPRKQTFFISSFFPLEATSTSFSLREGHSFLCVPKEKNQKKGQPRR
jgi:hypothetical protein